LGTTITTETSPVVLHGYETCFLILREESRWRTFENRIMRRITVFGPDGGNNYSLHQILLE
jgi:hypothetical protein